VTIKQSTGVGKTGETKQKEIKSLWSASALHDRRVYKRCETTHRIVKTHLGEPFELNTTNALTLENKWQSVKEIGSFYRRHW